MQFSRNKSFVTSLSSVSVPWDLLDLVSAKAKFSLLQREPSTYENEKLHRSLKQKKIHVMPFAS